MREVINMKKTKSLMLMVLGGCAVLAYQKYNKQIINSVRCMINKEKNMLDDALENMM